MPVEDFVHHAGFVLEDPLALLEFLVKDAARRERALDELDELRAILGPRLGSRGIPDLSLLPQEPAKASHDKHSGQTPQTVCHIMADVAQNEANDALSLNQNNPRAALKQFDNNFSKWYVGGPITSPFQARRWRHGTGREIDGRYAANASGLREEFRDTGTEPHPIGGRDAAQTHHFVAYFNIGINGGDLTYLLAEIRKDNEGDKRLSRAAFNAGYEFLRDPKKLRNVGKWIRENICTGSQGHGLYY